MTIYTMYPVIEVRVLEQELKTQFDVDVDDLSGILFYDDYQNDCYKSYCFTEDEVYEYPAWQNEEHIRIRNLVNAYLRDILPNYERVLIDVTW